MQKTQENKKQSRESKVIHLRDKCIGCAACVMLAPENWEMDEDGKATLKNAICYKKRNLYIAEIEAQNLEENKLAEEACPMGIIQVSE